MAKLTVGTTAQKIPVNRARPVIQNLGPGDVYIDVTGSVTASTGLKLPPNAVYEFPTPGALSDLWIIASQANTDVRVIGVG